MRPGARGLRSKSVWLQAGTSYWLHLGGWGERALGFFPLGTGFWLVYLVFAVVLNFVLNYALPL